MLSPAQVLFSNVTLLVWLPILALLTFLATRFFVQQARRQASADSAIPSGITLAQRPVLTPAETNFFRALQTAVGTEYSIFPQLPIWIMIEPAVKYSPAARAFTNQINLKRIDFLLVESATLLPYMAIELDDRSHQHEKSQQRDAFIDEVFAQAGLKLIHVRAAVTYNPHVLRKQLGLTVPETLSA
jgi:hypothetical protein